MPVPRHRLSYIPALILGATFILAATIPFPAWAATSVPLGAVVPLRGVAPGMDEIFLFLTGPNLPSDGVRLDNIRAPVISGKPSTFTRVDVVDDRWTYEWYTRTSGGVLDAGSYTIWATPFAMGLRDLRQGDHTAIPVTLTGNVNVPLGGTLFVNATPGAAVYLDGTLADHTPFMQKFVPAGNHTLTLKQEGYHDAVLYPEQQKNDHYNVFTLPLNAMSRPTSERYFSVFFCILIK